MNRSSACGSSESGEAADTLAGEGERDLGVRPPDEIDGGRGPCLVHRDDGRAVARDPLSRAERLLEGAAEGGEDVLDGVVLVDVEIAARDAIEIEAGVEGQQRQEMVEEADSRRDVRSAAAVEGERDPQRRLGARPDERRLTSRRRARLGSERAQQDVVLGRPAQRHPDPLGEPPHDDALRLEALAEVVVAAHPDEVPARGRNVEAGGGERLAHALALRDLGVDVVARIAERGRGDARGRGAIGAGARRASSTAAVAGAATA